MLDKHVEFANRRREEMTKEIADLMPTIGEAIYDATMTQQIDPIANRFFLVCFDQMLEAFVGLSVREVLKLSAISLIAAGRTLEERIAKGGANNSEDSGRASKTAVRAGKGASEGK